MRLAIINIENKEVGKKEMPSQFNENIRPDVVQRAVEALQANNRQRYGSDPRAGKKVSAKLSRRRHDYKGSYGHGISRVPRKILSRRGARFNWEGAFAPGMVGGRRAHPPKAEKNWEKKINKKENRLAIRSALSASMDKSIVIKRGHIAPNNYPFIISKDFQEMKKTNEVKNALESIGLKEELLRSAKKEVRAGKGKMRGRRYTRKKGPLIVVEGECRLIRAAKNIPGVDIIKVNELNAEMLAPGSDIGRLVLISDAAVDKIAKDKMFM